MKDAAGGEKGTLVKKVSHTDKPTTCLSAGPTIIFTDESMSKMATKGKC